MDKILDACVIIRLIKIGLFDEALDAYRGKLHVSGSANREVSKEPAHSTLQKAISEGKIREFKANPGTVEQVCRQMHQSNIKIHFDDVPNVVAASMLNAELITDDHVLFNAVQHWHKGQKTNVFVMNTRGMLFEMLLSRKLELVPFIHGVLELFRLTELPNMGFQLKKGIVSIRDIQRLFGEYEQYMLKALRIHALGVK